MTTDAADPHGDDRAGRPAGGTRRRCRADRRCCGTGSRNSPPGWTPPKTPSPTPWTDSSTDVDDLKTKLAATAQEGAAGEGHQAAAVGRPGHPQGLGQPDRLGRPAQRRLLTPRRLPDPALLARPPRRRRRTRRPLAVLDPHHDHRRNRQRQRRHQPHRLARPMALARLTRMKSGHYRTTNCRDRHRAESTRAAARTNLLQVPGRHGDRT